MRAVQDNYHLLAPVRLLVKYVMTQMFQMHPQLKRHLSLLQGKFIEVDVIELPRFFVFIDKDDPKLLWYAHHTVDCTVRGSLFALIRAENWKRRSLSGEGSQNEIFGDPITVAGVQSFVSQFEPDWEEALSEMLGDTLARKSAKSFQGAKAWAKTANASLIQSISEYLQEEQRLLATRPRVEWHLSEIQKLHEDVTVFERRLDSLNNPVS